MRDDALALLLDVGDADDTGCSRATELQNLVAAMRAGVWQRDAICAAPGMICANEKARALTRASPTALTLARRTAYFTLLKLFLLVLFVAIVILVVIILSVLLVLRIIPVLVGRLLALSPRILSLG
jgi:hypothetical protein